MKTNEAKNMSKPSKAVSDEGVRSFINIITQLCDGQAVVDLSNQAHELQEELWKRAASKGAEGTAEGKLKMEFKFFVDARGIAQITPVFPEIKAEKPKRASTPFWLTDGKNLSAKPPQQLGLPVAAVASPSKDVKAAGDTDEEEEDDDEDAAQH